MDVDPRFTPDGRYLLLVVGPHRHLRHLRLRARDRAALPGDERAVGRVPARGLARRQPARLHRLHHDGFDLYTMPFDPTSFRLAQPFANARLDAPTDPDADDDSPDAVRRRRRRAADDHAHDQLQALEVHVPAAPGRSASTRTRSASGGRRIRQHDHRRIRSATTAWASTCCSRRRRPVRSTVGYSYMRPVPVVRLSLPAHRPARARPGHRRRQHRSTGSTCSAPAPRRALPYLQTPASSGELSLRLRLHRVRAGRWRSRSPIRRAASSSSPRSGPDAEPVPVVVLLQRPQLALLDQQPGGTASSG